MSEDFTCLSHQETKCWFQVTDPLSRKLRHIFVSQREVRSDPEAVKQVARATNNLLDSLGSLAVEVRITPGHT